MTASIAADPLVPVILSTVVMIWAVIILFIGGTSRLTRQEKVLA